MFNVYCLHVKVLGKKFNIKFGYDNILISSKYNVVGGDVLKHVVVTFYNMFQNMKFLNFSLGMKLLYLAIFFLFYNANNYKNFKFGLCIVR
jgi:hypothetical protein